MNLMNALNETRVADVEKPKPLPQGTYTCVVTKAPTVENTKNGDWTVVVFPIKVLAAGEDVDPDEIEAFGNVTSFRGRISFMAPTDEDQKNDIERTLYNIRRFCEDVLGMETEDDENLMGLIQRAKDHQFIGTCVQSVRKDNGELQVDFPPHLCAAV